MNQRLRCNWWALVLVLLLWASLSAYVLLGPDPSRWDSSAPLPYADMGTTFFLHPESEQHLIPLWCP